jgi:hypothetical protein
MPIESQFTNLPGQAESGERGSDHRREALAARGCYDSLTDSVREEVDAVADAVANKAIETAEEKYGDAWFGGADFKRKLERAVRDYASGFDRSSEHLASKFVDQKDIEIAGMAHEIALSYIQSFPNLSELKYEPASEDTILPESNDDKFVDPVDTPAPKNDENEGVVLERKLGTSGLEEQITGLQALELNSEGEIQDAATDLMQQYPIKTRIAAVQSLFEHADLVPGLELSQKRMSVEAVILDNLSGNKIVSEKEFDRMVDHHMYKYGEEMEEVGLARESLVSLFKKFGEFPEDFSPEDIQGS